MPLSAEEIAANRAKFAAKMKNSGERVGNSRRKKKTTTKDSSAGDNKNLTAALKKLGANAIPGIEEVNMFTDDGNVIHFRNPKVQASPVSNTFAISGHNETKRFTEMFEKQPDLLRQLGMDGFQGLQEWAKAEHAAQEAKTGKKEEDIPELDGNFDDVEE